jgi:hypothetical protein
LRELKNRFSKKKGKRTHFYGVRPAVVLLKTRE